MANNVVNVGKFDSSKCQLNTYLASTSYACVSAVAAGMIGSPNGFGSVEHLQGADRCHGCSYRACWLTGTVQNAACVGVHKEQRIG